MDSRSQNRLYLFYECQSSDTAPTIKHIIILFNEGRRFGVQREELEISQIVAESLGLDPENQSNTVQFLRENSNTDVNYIYTTTIFIVLLYFHRHYYYY